ncbi:hypothetical protein DH2020_020194 [Rehmannia glutinosa]|uniref:Uncharacterized protein n=1 Tax=Rehmannia glutinosa TaxID=99300 RepID=A0ABR0WK80_REHGL
MNRREVGDEGFGAARRISNCLRDKDEELSFFRDIQKREKDQVGSLLHPVSDEFEPNGTNKSTPPNPKQKLPQRYKTPTGRPSISSLIDKKNMKSAPVINQKTNQTTIDKTKPAFTPVVKSIIHKEPNFPAPNTSNAKPKTRGVSPFARPKTIPGFSDETPSNLRTTNRPASANRGRPTNQNLSAPQKQDTNTKIIRRQSCSPSVARGRKVETDHGNAAEGIFVVRTTQRAENRAQVLGSRMVDRFMNARTCSAENRQAKIKLNGSMNESSMICSGEERQAKIKLNGFMDETSGFGSLMSKNSLDMALKHMITGDA